MARNHKIPILKIIVPISTATHITISICNSRGFSRSLFIFLPLSPYSTFLSKSPLLHSFTIYKPLLRFTSFLRCSHHVTMYPNDRFLCVLPKSNTYPPNASTYIPFFITPSTELHQITSFIPIFTK